MKKKFLLILLALVSALCLAFGLTACGKTKDNDGPDTPDHTHTWAAEWSSNSEGHFHYATCEGHETVKDKVIPHTFKNGECTICHYPDPDADLEPKQCTVTYNANGGAFAEGQSTLTQTVEENAKLTAPQSPARSNYTFAGWTKTKDGSDLWQFGSDAVTGDVTLWAAWEQKSAILLSVEGASIEGTEVFLYVEPGTEEVNLTGGKVVCSEDSTWHLYRKGSESEIYTKTASALADGNNEFRIVVASKDGENVNTYNFTVHRSYEATITYYDGESVLETATCYTGQSFTADYEPEITGYTFNKWTTAENEDFTSAVIWEPISLYVDKTAKHYKAQLDVKGGDTIGEEAEQEVEYDSGFTLPVPTRTGYTFTGWYTESTQEQEPVAITDEAGASLNAWRFAETTLLEAHWSANRYMVTIDQIAQAGTVTGAGEYEYDSLVRLQVSEQSIGYRWDGWYIGEEMVSASKYYSFTMGLDIHVEARWTVIPEMEPFVFTATSTECKITDVKDAASQVDLTILDCVTDIDYGALKWCVSLQSLTIKKVPMANFRLGSLFGGKNNVPATLKAVTIERIQEIRSYAFSDYSGLESVTIGEGVTKIADRAFENCSGLKNFNVPNSVTSIEKNAFYGCTSLESVTIGEGVKTIGEGAFKNCNGLDVIWNAINCNDISNIDLIPFDNGVKSVTFGESVKKIPAFLFYGCRGLTSVTIGSGVTSIGRSAFEDCYKLVEVWDHSGLGIQKGSSENGDIAYYAKYVYTGDEVSKQTVTDDGYIFYEDGEEIYLLGYCGPESSLSLPDKSPSGKNYALYQDAFRGRDVTSVTISAGVTEIGSTAFYGCDELTSIEIPNSVTSIGDYAFEFCRGLKSVTIGSGVASIEFNNSFSFCENLKSITVEAGNQNYSSQDGIVYNKQKTEIIFVPERITGTVTIPEGVTRIGVSVAVIISKTLYFPTA